MTLTTEEWIDELKTIPVSELVQRIQALEETFGVSATPQVIEQPQEAQETEPEEAPTVDVVITAVPEKRVPVIKLLRPLKGLTLKEAKDAVDELPYTVSESLDAAAAEKMKGELEAAGATVEIQ